MSSQTPTITSQQSTIIGGTIFSSMLTTFYISLITVGVILLLATIGSTSMNNLSGSIAGYSLVGAGILLLISYLLYGIFANKNEQSILLKNNRTSIMSAIYTTGPFFVVLGIISYSLYLLIKYKDRISQGNVAPGYQSFTIASIILILIQIGLFYIGTQKEGFKKTSRLDRVYSMLLYLIGIINIVIVITLYIILNFYSTDG